MEADRGFSDTLLVGFDFVKGTDEMMCVVGRRRVDESIEIVNVFQGQEAKELYDKLVNMKHTKEGRGTAYEQNE